MIRLGSLKSLVLSQTLPNALELIATSPSLTNLTKLTIITTSPILANLTALNVFMSDLDDGDDDDVIAIAESKYLAKLKLSDVSCVSPDLINTSTRCGIGSAGAKLIATSPTLSNLTTLYMSSNNINLEGAMSLVTSTTLGKLKGLIIDTNGIDEEGKAAIQSSQTLPSLTRLGL